MTGNEKLSSDSLAEANRDRAEFSGHGGALGAAGYIPQGGDPDSEYLSTPGQRTVINPHEDGFGRISIGAAWDNIVVMQPAGFVGRFLKRVKRVGIDIDLGCLYELADGTRGCVQAFGEQMGDYNTAPFIALSGDERTGNTVGNDEIIDINGKAWPEIRRILLYAYIYGDGPNWAGIRPQIQISVPGEHPMFVLPDAAENTLCICALALMENIRNGIRLTNHSEYFLGHAEMDRAFGFGLEWEDGKKAAPAFFKDRPENRKSEE